MLVWLLRNLKFKMSEDNENTITVDVISSALLTWLLVPILRSSASNYNIEPVVSVVGSGIHFWTNFPERKTPNSLATLNDEKTADMENRFAHSHLIQSPLSHTFPPVLHDRLEGGSNTDSRIHAATQSVNFFSSSPSAPLPPALLPNPRSSPSIQSTRISATRILAAVWKEKQITPEGDMHDDSMDC